MLKHEFTFSEVSEQVPDCSVPDYTFWLQRKFLEGTEISFRDIALIVRFDTYLQK